MIGAFVSFSVRHRGWVIASWGVISVALLIIALNLKLDALPDITSNQVQVLTRAPGLTPEEVEQRVTRPLEAGFGGLPGLLTLRSLSRSGLSAITLVFDDDLDVLRARQLVAERMVSAKPGVGAEAPELGPISGGLGEVFHFTVSSPTRTPAQLLELIELRAAPILKTVPGIVEVNTWGGARRTLEVHADANQLVAHRVSFDALKTNLERSVGSQPGASLESGNHQVLLRGSFLPTAPSMLADALVRFDEGSAIRVGDLATIRDGSAPRLGAATRDGLGETVYVMAQMLIGANARDVTQAVRAKMAEVKKALPDDVQLDVVYDRSVLVNATLRTVAKSLAEGGLLVCLVLFLMLGSARAGLVVALTIPVAMLGATAVMTLLGVSGNLMSLGAVDFGLLVDGAVVLMEHVFRTAQGASTRPWHERVAEACAAVARPSFFGVSVILLVYVPVLSLTGVDGKMFRPMALTVVLALVVTLLFTLTFISAAAAAFLRERDVPAKDPRLVVWVQRAHSALLGRTVTRPALVLGLTVAALVASVALVSRLGTELAPTLDEGAMVIQTTRAADLGITGAVEQALAMERAIRTVPEVQSVVSRVGSPAVATDTMGVEQSDVFVTLTPRAAWRPGLTRAALVDQLSQQIERATPFSQPAFTQPIQMRFNELLGGAPYDVVVSVIGQDLPALRRSAQRVLSTITGISGIEDARVLADDEVPLQEVRPDSLAAGQQGLGVAEVLDLTGALRLGLPVGTTYDGPREIPVTLRLGAEAPEPIDLARTPLPTPRGLVPLGAVAHLSRVGVPAALYRVDGERRVLLGFNVRGRELGEVVTEAGRLLDHGPALEEGTRVSWGGQFETLEAAKRRLALVLPAVLVLIAFVLFIHFGRRGPVLWVLSHVPFAAIGGVFALWSRGMALSISAGIGFIALWGIAVMNGTVLVTAIDELEHGGVDPQRATLEATHERTRPVAMTALVAALGFLPMALAQGVGSEVQRPLATVVIGGLLSSTVLTLLVLPTLRVAFMRRWPPTP